MIRRRLKAGCSQDWLPHKFSLKGRPGTRHFPGEMKATWCILLGLCARAWAADPADNEAIRKAIATFNDPHERATVLARDADLSPLGRFAGQEVSQVYFEAKAIRFVTADVAFVDAAASQYGSTIMKRSMRAVFVVKREGGAWRISVMRIT
jgi:hypothetical protein